jgi:hypothetical protein
MRALLTILAVGSAFLPAIASAADTYLFDLLRRPQYRRSYNTMLSTAPATPKWVAYYSKTLDGPSQPAQNLKVDGDTYLLADVCKTHDCDDHKLQVVFAPDGRQAWGRTLENGSTTWIGSPSPGVRKAVERIGF